MVPLVPKLAVTTPATVLPVPMAPIMLSPPPALTRTLGFRPSSRAVASCKRPAGWSLRDQGAARPVQFRVDGLEDGAGPLALFHVEQGGAAGVAEFHDLVARQPEIQVIVREQDGGEARRNSPAPCV